MGTVKENLLNNQPVILTANGSLFTGHAWVVDGILESYDCVSGCGWLSHHMNWGWNDKYDGWYGISDWTPGDSNYDANQKAIVNIHP